MKTQRSELILLFSPDTIVFSTSKNLIIKIYKTIILPLVLYGCEIWSLALKEECRLRVFGNWIPRRIHRAKRDENGEWRKLHKTSFIVCIVHLI